MSLRTVWQLHSQMYEEAMRTRGQFDRHGSPAWASMKEHQIRIEHEATRNWQEGSKLLVEFDVICRDALGGTL